MPRPSYQRFGLGVCLIALVMMVGVLFLSNHCALVELLAGSPEKSTPCCIEQAPERATGCCDLFKALNHAKHDAAPPVYFEAEPLAAPSGVDALTHSDFSTAELPPAVPRWQWSFAELVLQRSLPSLAPPQV